MEFNNSVTTLLRDLVQRRRDLVSVDANIETISSYLGIWKPISQLRVQNQETASKPLVQRHALARLQLTSAERQIVELDIRRNNLRRVGLVFREKKG